MSNPSVIIFINTYEVSKNKVKLNQHKAQYQITTIQNIKPAYYFDAVVHGIIVIHIGIDGKSESFLISLSAHSMQYINSIVRKRKSLVFDVI